MEAVKQVIDSNLLTGIIALPKFFQNKKVEITVSVQEEKNLLPIFTMCEIDAMLEGSVAESLIGVLPQSDLSPEDYRTERLRKYEHTN
jgi:hypothetical protein